MSSQKILEFLKGKGFTRSIDIARGVYGASATRKLINKDIYELLSQGKVEKVAKENGGDPRWRLTSAEEIPTPKKAPKPQVKPVVKVSDEIPTIPEVPLSPKIPKEYPACSDCKSKSSPKIKCTGCSSLCCEDWGRVTYIVEEDFQEDDQPPEIKFPVCLDCYKLDPSYFPDLANRKRIQRDLHKAKS
jgi:hypothetical protein